MNLRNLTFATLALGVTGSALAITVDGTAEGAYGSALFTQTNPTGFGDNNDPSFATANGSEIDGVFGLNDGTNLSAVVTGNLETNFNKLVIFIDSKAGGFNTITNTNASSDDFGFVNGTAGLTFDAGFEADYVLWIRGNATDSFLTLAELGAGGDLITGQFATGTLRSSGGFSAILDNSNVAGVTGSGGSGAGVLTGFEFSMDLSTLGATGSSAIKLAGFVTGGNFMSNQVIGGVSGGNLGDLTSVNFSSIGGDQFVEVAPVPEPGTLAVLGLGLLAARRRRK